MTTTPARSALPAQQAPTPCLPSDASAGLGTPPQAGEMLGVVLAGGLSRRMHRAQDRPGFDKGLLPLAGRALAAWVIERLRPQVGQLVINVNRHRDDWAQFGYPLIADARGGFAGPLAGVEAALHWVSEPAKPRWILTAPCDGPFFPLDLAQRMAQAATDQSVPLVIARTPLREHPAYLLAHRDLLAPLRAALDAGQRAMSPWVRSQRHADVLFDDEAAFANLNTPEDFEAAQARCTEGMGDGPPRVGSP